MSSVSESKEACKKLNGEEHMGRRMRVQTADADSGLKKPDDYPEMRRGGAR